MTSPVCNFGVKNVDLGGMSKPSAVADRLNTLGE